MEQQTASSLVDFLGQYGVTGLLVLLGAAVVFLYRQHSQLSKEVCGIVEKYATDLASCQKDTLHALEKSTEAVNGVQQTLKELRESLGR